VVEDGGLAAVVPGLLTERLPVIGGGPEVVPGLARRRHHGRQEHEQVDRHPCADERSHEASVRMAHHDEAGALADGVDDRVDVLRQTGRLVVARQIHRDRVGPASAQLGSHEVPVPGAAAGTVDQDVGGRVAGDREWSVPGSNRRPPACKIGTGATARRRAATQERPARLEPN
jgi:hypothetical protein